MRLQLWYAAAPRAVVVVATTLLIVALSATAVAVGSQLSPSPRPAPPTGTAGNGLIAFDAVDGDIWIANADGSDPRRLTTDQGVDIDPAWSPDGLHLAYWSIADPDHQHGSTYTNEALNTLVLASTATLVVTDPTGVDRRILVSDVHLDTQAYTPTWAPDSRQLVYSLRIDGQPVIEVVSIDDGGPPRRIGDGSAPVWSPDGGLIAYRAADGGSVMVVTPNGSEPRSVSTVAGDSNAFYYPQWSPDSSTLVFYASAGAGDVHNIWTVDLITGSETMIGAGLGDEIFPAFSPDGAYLAFDRIDASGVRLVTTDPNGTNEVSQDPPIGAPGAPTTWSPDATMLLTFRVSDGAPVIVDARNEIEPTVISGATVWFTGSWQRLAP
jgi:Tol biopolymer transport system component